ncbi:HET domain-containing protein, partial [Alternaria rosae]|uniref:HET domain-containing protein n=1 Tax=Alternaria rosae TaxID=1187941 RepID=UPI001E8D694C
MWLLNTTTLKLRHFITNIPDYVILSHTWGEGEVSFVDIAQPYAKGMTGYSKISRCCVQALEAGFEWAWVDTCCIDKRSSAELSEAINSMYKWYWDAAICYVLISDRSIRRTDLESSRWFERGWTLQELLAPDAVEFFDSDWKFLGTRTGLVDRIFAATKIDKQYLLDRTAIEDASLATKFSWASARRTTREEDKAYCLLGLVQVNMPMLYGEGSGAFYRLQLEIIKQTNDHTIFAWSFTYPIMRFMSIFAPSPAQFENAAGFLPNTTREKQPATHEMTNQGLNITIPCIIHRTGVLALLDCSDSTGKRFGIELESTGVSTYRRLDKPLVEVAHRDAKQAKPKNIYL